MEGSIAKVSGSMVLTGGAIVTGTATDTWMIPVFLGIIAAGLAAFSIGRTFLTRKGAAKTATTVAHHSR